MKPTEMFQLSLPAIGRLLYIWLLSHADGAGPSMDKDTDVQHSFAMIVILVVDLVMHN